MGRSDVAMVVIGRNEGSRLDRCLRSARDWRIVYVDSASTDGSADLARIAGAEVIEIDPASGLSPARGRNAGLDRLTADSAIRYVQMLDGDCELAPGWIEAGAAALDADAGLGAVTGQLREIRPDESIYNWMCDVEWTAGSGGRALFGGNVLLRADAVRSLGGYRVDMIAGEDPDLAIRLRAAGWTIGALPAPMARHDAAMTRFGQWWRRTVRAGHAFEALVERHPCSPFHDFARSRRRILGWAGIVPLIALAGLLLAILADRQWIVLTIAMLLLVIAQWLRVGLREARRHPRDRAFGFAFFLAIGKYAEMIGLIRYRLDRWRGRPSRLIEHRAP